MYTGAWCYRCNAQKTPDQKWNDVNAKWLTHNDSAHIEAANPEWIEAKDIRGGDRALLDYRGQRVYLRVLSNAKAKANKPGYVGFMDSAHRGFTVPADKLISVYQLTDEIKEQ